jgi:hypothetical protein
MHCSHYMWLKEFMQYWTAKWLYWGNGKMSHGFPPPTSLQQLNVPLHLTSLHSPTVVPTIPFTKIQYNLCNPTYMGPRYCRIIVEKVGKIFIRFCFTTYEFQNWLSFNKIYFIDLFYIYKCALWISVHSFNIYGFISLRFYKKKVNSFLFLFLNASFRTFSCNLLNVKMSSACTCFLRPIYNTCWRHSRRHRAALCGYWVEYSTLAHSRCCRLLAHCWASLLRDSNNV